MFSKKSVGVGWCGGRGRRGITFPVRAFEGAPNRQSGAKMTMKHRKTSQPVGFSSKVLETFESRIQITSQKSTFLRDYMMAWVGVILSDVLKMRPDKVVLQLPSLLLACIIKR